MPVVSLSLFRFPQKGARIWVLGQMALARISLARMPGLSFWKLCGSGTGEGFTPKPNWQVWAILGVWTDETAARRAIASAPVWGRWRARALESWTIYLDPATVRGHWSGVTPFPATGTLPQGPLAAMTRATVRPTKALRFWRRVPDISAVIGEDPNVIFKIGIGEVPLIHQVTFSIWPDAASMSNFARGDGPHGRAIRAVRDEGWFNEELYARFRILGAEGLWEGGDPLRRLPPPESYAKDAA
jgi:spheroidene monooxygenase